MPFHSAGAKGFHRHTLMKLTKKEQWEEDKKLSRRIIRYLANYGRVTEFGFEGHALWIAGMIRAARKGKKPPVHK